MKTILQWIKTLPKKDSKNAIKYARNNYKHCGLPRCKYASIKNALFVAFVFSETIEGPEYWFKICNNKNNDN